MSEETKRLIVVRHAKSSWEKDVPTDFERPLNDRGKRDAPVMAQRLLDRKISIDAFVASPAKRTTKMAEIFCDTFGEDASDIIFIAELYHASANTFYNVVAGLDNSFDTVIIFSHNPGITDFVNSLTDVTMANMPTCAMFAVDIKISDWSDFQSAEKEFLFFDYPKNATD